MPDQPGPAVASDRSRIQLCGRLSVEIDGVQLAGRLRGRQVPLVLAYLALHRDRQVSRDELADALWPSSAPRSAEAALRTLLSRLRAALGSSALDGRDQLALVLPEPAWIDVEAAAAGVARAREALELGEPRGSWALAQVPLNISARGLLPGAQAPWLEPWRRELRDLRMQALEVVGRAGLLLGGSQLRSAERAARTLIDSEPYRESGYVLLMQALAAAGNVAEGLRVFERLRALLAQELGTVPSPEALAAHDALLHPTRRRRGVGPREEPIRTPLPDALRPIRTPLPDALRRERRPVGRAAELSELEPEWEGEKPPIALLVGDPGQGKTTVLAEVARRAHERGGTVLYGQTPEEALVPYHPVLQALGDYIARAPLERVRDAALEHGGDLARLVPELRRRLPGLPPATTEPDTERYRLFEALAGMLAAIAASARLLLVLDDLHWADRSTLMLVRHLARTLGPDGIRVLAAYRTGESERRGPFADALAELRHRQLVRELALKGLSEEEVGELVRADTGTIAPLALTRALHRRTEGNPLFISQILGEFDRRGLDLSEAGPSDLQALGLPEDIRRVIAHRLWDLSAGTLEWLRTAAVIGREFDVKLIEAVSPLSEDQSIAALEEALRAGVVRELEPGAPRPPGPLGAQARYAFAHVLVRETVYAETSAVKRARLHRRVGEVLERRGEGAGAGDQLPGERVAVLARHFTAADLAGDAAKAIGYARQAGERAAAMLAYEEAAEHFARALAIVEGSDRRSRLELLLALAEAYVLGEDQPLAAEPLREAAELAIELADVGSLGRAALLAARRYVQRPGVLDEELVELLERALEMTEGERSTLRVALLARACGALYYAPDRDRMHQLAAEATAIARELGEPEAGALAAAARRRASWGPGRLEQRLADSSELLAQAREASDLPLTLQGHACLVVDLLERGDLAAVDAQIEAFDAGAEQLRQPLYLWQGAVWRAMRALLAGRIEEAERSALLALSIGARAESITARQYYAAQMLAIRREQGRLAELEPALRTMLEQHPNRLAFRAALAAALCEQGSAEKARRELESLSDGGFAGIPEDLDWLTTMSLLADVTAELEAEPQAERLYELLAPHGESSVVVGWAVLCEGPVARHLGRLAALLGRRDDAERWFAGALERARALAAPVFATRTRLDHAQALGRGPRAGALVDHAAHTAQELGLQALARRAIALRRRLA